MEPADLAMEAQPGSELIGSQPDQAEASGEIPSGGKRKRVLTPEQRKKKNEDSKAYRKRCKGKLDEIHGFKEMEKKFGTIEEMEYKLHIFQQITSMFGGIDKALLEINRLKNIEFQHSKCEQMDSRLNQQNVQPSSNFLLQMGGPDCWRVYFHTVLGLECSDILDDHSDVTQNDQGILEDRVVDIMAEFKSLIREDENNLNEMNEESTSQLFLYGEGQTVGGYTSTRSLVLSANDILDDHSDFTQNDQGIVEDRVVDLNTELGSLVREGDNILNEVTSMNEESTSQLFKTFGDSVFDFTTVDSVSDCHVLDSV
ncbi:hypothetical protein PTKIN_Ptkin03bG0056700 [Pterospermum kingtungense]